MKLKKGEINAALKLAIKASLEAKSSWVPVDHPAFAGHVLRATKARMWRVQKYPSTIIVLRHVETQKTVWDTTSGYLSLAVGLLVERGKLSEPM